MADPQNPYQPPATSAAAPVPQVSIPAFAKDVRLCPFCGQPAPDARCPGCGRDPSARRAVCKKCHGQTPLDEPICCHCQASRGSELAWKVPLIIALFVLALVVSIAVRLF